MLLCPYNPESRPEAQHDTYNWIMAHVGLGLGIRCRTVDDNTEYSEIMIDAFRQYKAFIVLEQDIVPSEELLWSIVFCPEPICVSNYQLYSTSTLINDNVYVNRNVTLSNAGRPLRLDWVDEDAEWCDFYGLGFTAFKDDGTLFKEILSEFKPCHYSHVDHLVSQATWHHNRKAHIHHEPIVHNHR